LSGFGAQPDKNVSRETFWYGQGRNPYKASYRARLAVGGIARINRPMCHQDHHQKLGGTQDLSAPDFCTKKVVLNQGPNFGAKLLNFAH
jgi:hypothetical protein